MTKFWREGHVRIGPYGDEHWVEGHWVDRSDWDRAGHSSTWNSLCDLRADKGMTSAYVVPNARCPVCGESVFFYANEHGSRVYFDELGDPWPKHPCMDQPGRGDGGIEYDRTQPGIRSGWDVGQVDRFRRSVGLIHFARDHYGGYGTNYYYPWVVLQRFKIKEGVLIAAMNLSDRERVSFFLVKSAKASLKRTAIFFPKKGVASYFDPASMEVIRTRYKRISSKDFVAGLLDVGGMDEYR